MARKPFWSAILLLIASTATLSALEAEPRETSDVAAVFPPWLSSAAAFAGVAKAGGDVVRAGVLPTILVAHGDDPGFPARLHEAGAWLVLDPFALGGCLTGNATFSGEAANEPNS